jgi:hypothetical protein
MYLPQKTQIDGRARQSARGVVVAMECSSIDDTGRRTRLVHGPARARDFLVPANHPSAVTENCKKTEMSQKFLLFVSIASINDRRRFLLLFSEFKKKEAATRHP